MLPTSPIERTILFLACASAMAVLSLQYHYGIGLNPDSAIFISAADSVLSGHGLTSAIETIPHRLTHHPPGFPLLLVALKGIFGDFLWAATFLNFASLLFCFLAAHAFVRRQAGTGPALAAICLLTFANAIYSVHYTLGTDAPAMPLMIAAMCWLGDFNLARRWRALVFAALALAVAALVRYAYLAFIPASTLVILLDRETSVRIRLRSAFLLAVIACGPMAMVVLENMLRAGTATNRVLSVHLVSLDQLRDGADYLSSWLLPYRIPVPLRFIVLLIACSPGLVLAVRGPWKFAARITISFLISYGVLLLVTTSLLDASTPFDERLLAPAAAILCMHLALVSGWLWRRWRRWGPIAATLLVLAPAVTGARRLLPRTFQLYRFQDQGNSLAKLKNDYQDVIPLLEALPPGSAIYSNVPSDIYLVSRKYALDLPIVRGKTDARQRTEAEVSSQVGDLWRQVSASRGLVLYHLRGRTLSDLSMIWWDELIRRVPLIEIFRSDSFVVYAAGR
jgi:Dolichyl-phosphate-mannose-protein mannosyltransferase